MFINSLSLEDDPPRVVKNAIEAWQSTLFTLFDENKSAHKGKFWVAGGALRDYFFNVEPRDIDIYTKDNETRFYLLSKMLEYGGVAIEDTPISTVYDINGLKIDLIKKHFSSPAETLWSFDLSPCLCATDGESLFYEENYFMNLTDRNLEVFNVHGGIRTLERIIRYTKMGFDISRDDLTKFMGEFGIHEEEEDLPAKVETDTISYSPLSGNTTPKTKRSFRKLFPHRKEKAPIYNPGILTPPPNNYPNMGGGKMTGTGTGIMTGQGTTYLRNMHPGWTSGVMTTSTTGINNLNDTVNYNIKIENEDIPF